MASASVARIQHGADASLDSNFRIADTPPQSAACAACHRRTPFIPSMLLGLLMLLGAFAALGMSGANLSRSAKSASPGQNIHPERAMYSTHRRHSILHHNRDRTRKPPLTRDHQQLPPVTEVCLPSSHPPSHKRGHLIDSRAIALTKQTTESESEAAAQQEPLWLPSPGKEYASTLSFARVRNTPELRQEVL